MALASKLKPGVTIAVPVYNEVNGINDLVKHLLNVDADIPVQILFVDDGSDDGTFDCLGDLSKACDRVRVLGWERNLGRPFSRNEILRNVETEWLMWVDADDLLDLEKLPVQLDYIRHRIDCIGDDNILVTCKFRWLLTIDDVVVKDKEIVPIVSGDQLKNILTGEFGAYLWLLLGKTDVWRSVGYFDTNLPRLQDLDFLIRLVNSGVRIELVESDRPLITYHKTYEGRSAVDVFRSWQYIMRKHAGLYGKFGYGFVMSCRATQYKNIARFYRINGNKSKWLSYVLLAYFCILVSPYGLRERIANLRSGKGRLISW